MKLTDIEQISAIRSRNEYLTGKIYGFYRNEFLSFIKNKIWKDGDAILDIYQDSFLIVCKKIYENKLDETTLKSTLKTYLFGVGVKLTQNFNRKKGAFQKEDLNEIQDIIDEESGLGEENEKLIQTAVYQMGEPCHTILVKQYWEDKSGDEIAAEMHYKNKDAAKTQKYKCIQKLKSDLKGKIVYQS
jgi:DNA-directed RNA polymerase specialized sigma24 family protein